ncbi:tripartite tricarboxylate transporter permease [Actinotalea sp. Marseille-Q4924]|uniref:tripartite tricarboxylate transporter permease n=1 Tax=Actinotalea sp. Marseille-Q4924 TaxID=2866571 RepID=UPI001CE44728|nr:tripartite tricarboxylate transporter permease [Actinotalea sp. Marseille-Q4924]
MGQSVLDGLLLLLQPVSLLYLTVGMAIGLVIGFLPGLGGLATLALLTPLIIGMDPAQGLAFILGAYGAVSFGGSITAILFGVPGTGEQVVTTFDGYPMARQGRAGRALGVSAAASAFGGLFGVVVLILAIPIALQLMTYIRSPEVFMLGILGILVIGISDADTRLKGVISGVLGLMLSFIGLDPITGISRMTFGNLELMDGLSITAITMGLFAVSEMYAIYTRGVAIAGNAPASRSKERGSRVVDGVMDGVRNWRTVLQSGSIGAVSGVVPGVGGTLGMFGAYALAKRSSKDPESFGKGNPVGVLAPEAANNAKEGGSFVPTLSFGIPGSSGMALVIVILLILGFVPGPDMINNHLDIVFLIAWVMALSNILCSVMGLALAPTLAKLAFVRPQLLAPALIAIALLGSFIDSRMPLGIVVALIFGVVGYIFKATGYSAAGVTLGFVLGPLIDQNLGLSLQVFGPSFLLRPIPIVLIVLVVLVAVWPKVKDAVRRRRSGSTSGGAGTDRPSVSREVTR